MPPPIDYRPATPSVRPASQWQMLRLTATLLFVLGLFSIMFLGAAFDQPSVPWPVYGWLALTFVVAPAAAGYFALREHAARSATSINLKLFAGCCFALVAYVVVGSLLTLLGIN